MIGTFFSGYRIIEKIGGGNTGVVYRAFDPEQKRYLALKILPNDFLMSKEKKARFMRETQAAGILSHNAIARLYDAGEYDHHFFLAMEFVEGTSFSKIIETHPEGISLEDFHRLMLPVLDGIAFSHGLNLVHRDLKPDHLVLNSEGHPKVLDFGLAKFLDKDSSSGDESYQTMAGMVLGSACYMSPEQADGSEFDVRTDIFSLGVIMYELLTGKNPFQGNGPFATMAKILTLNPVSIELIRPDVPLPLGELVLRCLAKAKEDRFPNAAAVQQNLLAIKAGA